MAHTSLADRELMTGVSAPDYLFEADDRHYYPHGHVPILDADLVEDEFEPDGVNDFVREFGAADRFGDL